MSDAELKPADKVEELVRDSLSSLKLHDGLAERIGSALPPHTQMHPSLHPALRLGFGLTAAVFAAMAWTTNLPDIYGATAFATTFGLTAILLGAAIGAVTVAVAIVRETGKRAIWALRDLLEGLKGVPGNAIVATVAAATLLLTTWILLGSFPDEYMRAGVRAARSSTAILAVILLSAAGVQIWMLTRGKNWKPALRLVEAAGLVVSAVACVANYVIYVA